MNEFDNIDDLDEELEIITVTDDEIGEEIEFVVVDMKIYNEVQYMLVIESQNIDDDEAEAAILKVVNESGDEVTYGFIEDDEEFDKVAALFESDEYDVEI